MLKKIGENDFPVREYIHPFPPFIAKHDRNYPKLMFDERECLGTDSEEYKRRGKQTKKKRDIRNRIMSSFSYDYDKCF
jgi:hypothetical protein